MEKKKTKKQFRPFLKKKYGEPDPYCFGFFSFEKICVCQLNKLP